jgi:hypothetical protein
VGFQHAGLAVEDHWVEKFRNVNLVPCFAENDITFEDFILKCGSEATFRSPLFDMLLYLTSDPTDCPDLSPTEFSDLQLTIKHPLYKGSVFVDLKRLTYQFELLHHLKVRIKLDHNAGHTNSEMSNILPQVILQFLNSYEGGTQGIGRPVEGCVAETEFRCVFNHS